MSKLSWISCHQLSWKSCYQLSWASCQQLSWISCNEQAVMDKLSSAVLSCPNPLNLTPTQFKDQLVNTLYLNLERSPELSQPFSCSFSGAHSCALLRTLSSSQALNLFVPVSHEQLPRPRRRVC